MAMDNYKCFSLIHIIIVSIACICNFAQAAGSGRPSANSFNDNFVANWAPPNVRFQNAGSTLQLVLDPNTGSGFASKNSYLFGNIDMQIKLVPGDSAGTVTAYYLSSETANHDELDFEFLGNKSGQPYILQTNVFSNGVGGREQRIYLWFDPTADFHTYSISWTKRRILFLVDGVPIRVFSNNAAAGVPYLNRQPMRLFSSIWNGDSWATRGGLDKIDWSRAPFIATYRNFRANACVANSAAAASSCASAGGVSDQIDGASGAANNFNRNKLQWVKKNFMVYDYCSDKARYPAQPAECSREY